MQILEYADAQAFLTDCQAFLEQQEVSNSLLLGRAFWLTQNPLSDQSSSYLSVKEGQHILFSCLQTPPHHFIFSTEVNQSGLNLLLNHLLEKKSSIPGFVGPRALVLKAAKIWAQKTGGQHKVEMRQLIYRLDTVTFGRASKGQFRIANPMDQAILQKWIQAFSLEAMGQDSAAEIAEQITFQKIKEQDLFVWENEYGIPLSMAGIARPTRHGICINYVYTPLANRRQGLAGACVAALSQQLLDEGYEFCTLFTDANFPTSNRIYQSIGYQEVAVFASISLLK
jgi:hypothetical protein